jgi:hypothetical protein
MRVAGEADAKDLWGGWRWAAWAAATARERPHPPHQDRLWAPSAPQLIRPPPQDSQVPIVTHILARALGLLHCKENPIYVLPDKNCAASVPISTFMHPVSDLYIPRSVGDYYCKRPILLFVSRLLRPASVYPPPLLRGEDTLAARRVERGVGGQYFGRRQT